MRRQLNLDGGGRRFARRERFGRRTLWSDLRSGTARRGKGGRGSLPWGNARRSGGGRGARWRAECFRPLPDSHGSSEDDRSEHDPHRPPLPRGTWRGCRERSSGGRLGRSRQRSRRGQRDLGSGQKWSRRVQRRFGSVRHGWSASNGRFKGSSRLSERYQRPRGPELLRKTFSSLPIEPSPLEPERSSGRRTRRRFVQWPPHTPRRRGTVESQPSSRFISRVPPSPCETLRSGTGAGELP